MVLLMNVYRNLTSLSIKPRERAFKQFKCVNRIIRKKIIGLDFDKAILE